MVELGRYPEEWEIRKGTEGCVSVVWRGMESKPEARIPRRASGNVGAVVEPGAWGRSGEGLSVRAG